MSVPDPNRHIDAAFIDVEEGMETKITEIADGIYRLSTYVPHIAPPAGFTYNQFLVLGHEPLMFHTGLRKTFPVNRDALSRIMPADRLRWIAFGHFEADVRRDERMARGRTAGDACSRSNRLHGITQRFCGSSPARIDGRRSRQPWRRQARPFHRHTAHPTWLRRRGAIRRVDTHFDVR